MPLTLESLPVELITSVLEELDLSTLAVVADLSKRLRAVSSDTYLNPWRRPIIRALLDESCEDNCNNLAALQHLCERPIVPRQNWIHVLIFAPPSFILFDSTIPNLRQEDWEYCYKMRFLPSWIRWKRDRSWREAFKRTLTRVWHRSQTSCTAEEAWTKYITLNKNGSANELQSSSRTFNPITIFNEMKVQSNLVHLETHIRLVVTFADVRILALGVLNRPRGTFSINRNARHFLHPPGIENEDFIDGLTGVAASSAISHHRDSVGLSWSPEVSLSGPSSPQSPLFSAAPYEFERLSQPLPSLSHRNYPFYTPGGEDKRWIGRGPEEEGGRLWVGGMMLVAQITGPNTKHHFTEGPAFQDLDLTNGPGRGQYVSLTWDDLDTIAPWMDKHITTRIDGPGLGI